MITLPPFQTGAAGCVSVLRHLQPGHHPARHPLQEAQGVQVLKSNLSRTHSNWLLCHVQVLTIPKNSSIWEPSNHLKLLYIQLLAALLDYYIPLFLNFNLYLYLKSVLLIQWDDCDLPAPDGGAVCADQVGQAHGLLCDLHQSADEDLEVSTHVQWPKLHVMGLGYYLGQSWNWFANS